MPKGTTLKLFWHVERSRGGTGDYWLNIRGESGGVYAGMSSMSMSRPEKQTLRDLCMSALHLAEPYMKKEADLQVIKHSMQYRIDTCPHKWVTCDETKALFCWHCDELQSNIEKNQQLNQA